MTIDPLFVDTYVGDHHGDVLQLMEAGPPWHGLVHKLTQGLYHDECERILQFRQVMLDHPRYAVDFWDGYYHFHDLNQDATAQADFFWGKMEKIGGERAGTIWAMIDVERGGQRRIPSAQQVFDSVGTWAARYEQLSGWKPTLYGGELLRALGIHKLNGAINLLGCGRNSIALYGPTLAEHVVIDTGTDEAHLFWWQYDGDGEAYLKDYPREAPGFGRIDISVLTCPNGLDGLRAELQVGTHAPVFDVPCDHRDGYGSLFLDGRCMVCGVTQP
jgi:hypothetical protein